ncbi:hypothetical protein GOV04_02325 [Candidatus Woesearchaeota archaeon]|nr:hypothetical protein [Candidatus Woesearchaeota archaeon]
MKIKAQLTGQFVVYMAAAVVAVIVVIYGFSAIKTFLEQRGDVETTKLVEDLKTEIIKMATQPRDVEQKNLRAPLKYTQLCFIDSQNPGILDDPLINESYQSGKNFFLISNEQTIGYDIGIIVTSPQSPLCIDNPTGLTKLRLEGLGNSVQVSEWPTNLQ